MTKSNFYLLLSVLAVDPVCYFFNILDGQLTEHEWKVILVCAQMEEKQNIIS